MSKAKQCPSTTKTKPASKPRTPHNQVGAGPTGQAYWRSLDDLADTPQFREWLEREFPAGASELLEGSRRTFLKLMGASLALAGVSSIPGCRRPDHKIMPYSKNVPEEVIPGKPIFYATSMPLPGGGAEGLLIETHEGRPTKVEGNPLHPANGGRTSAWAQSSVLGLYDPDRLKDPIFTASAEPDKPRSWKDFALWSKDHFAPYAADGGDGLVFLVDKKSSPTLDAMRRRILKKFPKAAWYSYAPAEFEDPRAGLAEAFGEPVHEVLHPDKADVIVSLDRDFLGHEAGTTAYTRQFASRRRVFNPGDTMNRLYVVESSFTTTGAKADHRVKVAPSLIPGVAFAIARSLVSRHGDALADKSKLQRVVDRPLSAAGVDQAWIDAVADDLAAAKGAALLAVGPTQPLAVHVLAAAVNEQLGAIGRTVTYRSMSDVESQSSAAGITELARRINAGKVKTLVTLGVNPVYDAPAETEFAAAFARVPMRITLSVDLNETVEASVWRLPGAHYLESWSDTRSHDGTVAPTQPMIAPLYAGKSDIEVLAMIAGDEEPDGHEIVRSVWKEMGVGGGGAGFDKAWRRALHDGVLAGSTPAPVSRSVNVSSLAGFEGPTGPRADSLDVVFAVGMIGDGRYSNQGWLQEIPDPLTRIVWDNVAVISPETNEALKADLKQQSETKEHRGARMIKLTVAGRSMNLPVWVQPGLPAFTVLVNLGYGRTVCGVVGKGAGFNSYAVKPAGKALGRGGKIERAVSGPKWYNISSTQTHGSMEGRAIVRGVDHQRWQRQAFDESGKPFVFHKQDHYGNKRDLHFSETLGEFDPEREHPPALYAHSPENRNIYTTPLRGTKSPDTAAPNAPYAKAPQWGMTIDLAACTGCNTCTVACQAENNIPVVGKEAVNDGREMHWIRVDRYFVGEPDDKGIVMTYQPVPCMQCENAPCETVCPVNATVHGPEGINYMVYNRCIGTRYCANNCPYKVRRFNFFDFGVKKFHGDWLPTYSKDEEGKIHHGFAGRKTFGDDIDVNLVPPRLRQKLDQITRMQKNPDVTVRSRGVMEKCTYCIQRINESRIEVTLQGLDKIPDGFFQTACQQACPADAIVFGDIMDNDSAVTRMRSNGRAYMLLGFLNTRPRTLYMVEMKNPNPALVDEFRRDEWDKPFTIEESGGHGAEGEHGSPAAEHGAVGFLDRSAAASDRGYVMSLNVLGVNA